MAASATINVARAQEHITNYEADSSGCISHRGAMLSHAELLDELRRRRDEGEISNADLSRLLKLPTSRIADIFALDRTPRKITVDEMKLLVEHFNLSPTLAVPAEVASIFTAMSERERRRAVRMLQTLADEGDQAEQA